MTTSSTSKTVLENDQRAPGESRVGVKPAGCNVEEVRKWRTSDAGKAYCKRSKNAF